MHQNVPLRYKHLTLYIFLLLLLPINAMAADYTLPPADPAFSNGGFTLGAGDTLTINNTGTVTNNSSNILNYGTITNNTGGTITNNAGSIRNHNIITNNAGGTITNESGGTIENFSGSTLANSGSITNKLIMNNYATLTNNAGGTITNESGGYLINWFSATLTNNGIFTNPGVITNYTGSTFTNNTAITNSGTFRNSGTLNNSGTITNTGTLELVSGSSYDFTGGTLTNTGNFILRRDFTFNGTDGGTVNLNAGGTLTNYATLTNAAGYTQTNAGTIDNRGTLANSGTITNTGTLELVSGSSYDFTGGTLTNTGNFILRRDFTFNGTDGGTVNLNAGGTLTNYATLTNAAGYTQTNAGTIDNRGTFDNLGTFTNNGTFTNSGTLINNGTLNNTGTFTNSGTFTNAGSFTGDMTNSGILNGTGGITGNVTNNGTIAPGNSIGTIVITGNYIHGAGSTLQVEVNSAGQSDKIIVTGTATLNGGTVSVLAENGNYSTRTTYTILTAGSVVGAFSSVTSNLAFLTPSLSYDPTNVYLVLLRNSTDLTDVAYTANQYAVASAVDRTVPFATGDMEDVINTLLGLSASGARGAYDRMGGLVHTSLTGVSFSSFGRYMNVMSGRMGNFVSGNTFSSLPVMLASRTDTASDAGSIRNTNTPSPLWGLWMQGYGGTGERRGSGISSRYDYDMAGIAAGFDRAVSPSLLLGVSLGYSSTGTDMKDLSDKATIQGYQGSLYGIYRTGPFYLSGIAAYGYNRYDTRRDIAFGSIVRRARAFYAGHTAGGYIEGGYRIAAPSVDIIPLASITGIRLTRDSFRERNAGALSLDAGSDTSSSVVSSLGVRLTREYRTSSGTVTPGLKVTWDHEFIDDDYTLDASFAGYPLSSFTARGDRPDKDSLGAGLSLAWQTKGNLYLSLTYDGSFSSDNTQHAGIAGIRYRW